MRFVIFFSNREVTIRENLSFFLRIRSLKLIVLRRVRPFGNRHLPILQKSPLVPSLSVVKQIVHLVSFRSKASNFSAIVCRCSSLSAARRRHPHGLPPFSVVGQLIDQMNEFVNLPVRRNSGSCCRQFLRLTISHPKGSGVRNHGLNIF